MLAAFTPVVWLRAERPAARIRAAAPWLLGSIAVGGVAIAAALRPDYVIDIYFYTAAGLAVVSGALLLRRYGETVRGVRLVGVARFCLSRFCW